MLLGQILAPEVKTIVLFALKGFRAASLVVNIDALALSGRMKVHLLVIKPVRLGTVVVVA